MMNTCIGMYLFHMIHLDYFSPFSVRPEAVEEGASEGAQDDQTRGPHHASRLHTHAL